MGIRRGFRITGDPRSGRQAQPYALTSRPFTVAPWPSLAALGLQPGDRVRVDAGAVRDTYGNTNGASA